MRTINSLLNSSFAMISQFIILIFAFITRTVFIRILGSEYLGFDALFTNVLSILSIVDLGLGTALNFSLYKPIRDGEVEKVAAIIQYFKKIFSLLGILLCILSIFVVPFIGDLVKGSTNSIPYMQKVFLLYAILTFSSYFFTDVRTVFYAHQQNYKVLVFDFFTKILTKTLQVIILLIHPSYLWYLGIEILITLFFNFKLLKKAHIEYEFLYDHKVRLSESDRKIIFRDVKYLSLSKLSNIGISGTDSLIIAKFVGTAALGIYSNYLLILTSSSGLLYGLLNGIVASLGDLFAENNKEKIHQVFNLYNFISIQVGTFYGVATICLIQPFMHLWIGDKFLMDFIIVIVIIFNNYFGLITAPLSNAIITKGLFKQELPIRFIQVIINLIVSIYLASEFGLLGVFLGTAVCNLFYYFLTTYLVVKSTLGIKLHDFAIKEFLYLSVSLLEIIICMIINNYLPITSGLFSFCLNILFVMIMYICLEFIFYRKNNQMIMLLNIIRSQINKLRKI